MDNELQSRGVARQTEETSVIGLMEFTIAGNSYGINVAKVTEIMRCCPITPMTHSHHCVDGVFKPRGKIITVINLPRYLQLPESGNPESDMLMLTNFDSVDAAFLVHSVEAMHQIKWSAVERPSAIIFGGSDSVITGTTKISDRIVSILDFEKVLFDIDPETGIQLSEVRVMGERAKSEKPIVIVEDSVFLRKVLLQAVELAGFTNVTSFDNGLDAWEYLQGARDECKAKMFPIESKVALIITDIEMPRMDGHHLTKLVKSDDMLKQLPVLVFSSLIDGAQISQGEIIGVNAHLSKPQIGSLVATIDKWIL
ncbi:MAG: chemotaxis protein [Oscillospiraceae bacterium]|nr:chemotaxis protein [Oscillospiraceae bacterium]